MKSSKRFSKQYQSWNPNLQIDSNRVPDKEIALKEVVQFYGDGVISSPTFASADDKSGQFDQRKTTLPVNVDNLSRSSTLNCSQKVHWNQSNLFDADDSNLQKQLPLSEKEMKVIMRKIDFRLIPVIMFVFFYVICERVLLSRCRGSNETSCIDLSYLYQNTVDTSALVHAKVAGMTKLLHMSDGQYHAALVMYTVAHIIFVLPAMWFMQQFGSKIWISILVLMGGILMLASGFVTKPYQMIVLRTFLGLVESGMLPACLQTITLMYPRHQVQWRFALASTGGTIGGLVGGFIAFGLTDIHSKHIQGWRMIFIIEGIITMISAPLTYLMIPDSIEKCQYLTSDEKVQYQQMRSRNANNHLAKISNMTNWSKFKLLSSSLIEVKTSLAFLIIVAIYIPFQTLVSNLPVMMQEGFHFNKKQSQVLPIPTKLLSAFLLLFISWLSDRYEKRLICVAGPALLGSIGFIASLSISDGKFRYAMVYLADLIHVSLPSAIMILAQNIVCDTRRSAALGMQGFLAGLASIIGANLIWSKDAPRYVSAYLVMAICCLIVLISSGLLFLYLRRQNHLKQDQINSGLFKSKSKEELRAMGDLNPYFQYRY